MYQKPEARGIDPMSVPLASGWHGVDIGFAEEGSGNGDRGRNTDFSSLSEPALMTQIGVPLGVLVE